jgi:hypothetical protein
VLLQSQDLTDSAVPTQAVTLAQETPLPGVPLQEYLPAELQDRSTNGSNSLLQTADEYRKGKDKSWDEDKLLDWEWKQNKGKDWPGRRGIAG